MWRSSEQLAIILYGIKLFGVQAMSRTQSNQESIKKKKIMPWTQLCWLGIIATWMRLHSLEFFYFFPIFINLTPQSNSVVTCASCNHTKQISIESLISKSTIRCPGNCIASKYIIKTKLLQSLLNNGNYEWIGNQIKMKIYLIPWIAFVL